MRKTFFIFALALTATVAAAQDDRQQILALMQKVCDHQVALQAKLPPSNGWVRAAFYTGVIDAYHTTGDEKYLKLAEAWAKDQGDFKPALNKHDTLRFADNLCCGQIYIDLYSLQGGEDKITPTRAVFDDMIAHPQLGHVEWWWCDSLYMAPPTLTRMAKATKDDKYLKLLDQYYWDTTDFLYDREEHLFFRDKNYFDSRTKSGKKVFWSRGNGWVIAGLARLLPDIPETWPTRPKYVQLYKDMAEALSTRQAEDGLWRPSLDDPSQFPTPETSGTAFFTYAMTWGINNGVLDRAKYEPIVRKGWAGLVSKVTPEGKLGYVQKVAGAPGIVNPDDTNEYAGGAFLLAGGEMLKLNSGK
jgi:unsaturated rhamnogalacturonyl hydrolase